MHCRFVHLCRIFGRNGVTRTITGGLLLAVVTIAIPGVAAATNICDDPSLGLAAVKLVCGGFEKIERGDIDGAVVDGQRALALQPNLSEAHLMLGISYYDKKEYARALVEYNKYLAVNPDNYHAWNNRAGVFLRMGNLAEARSDIDRALVLKPNDPQLLWNRIRIASQADDWQATITDTTWLLDHYPPDAKWLVMRGRALGAVSREREALSDLQRAVRMAPTAEAYFYLGITRDFLGQYESAVEDFTSALSIDRTLVSAYLWRCRAQYHLQQFRAGLLDCDEYVKRNPEDYEGYYVRGILRSRARDQDGALADYRHATELAKTMSERANAWYGIGLANERAGRVKDAREAYYRTLQIDPQYRRAREALGRLRR